MNAPADTARTCSSCGANFLLFDSTDCPACGGALHVALPKSADAATIELSMSFAQWSCETCAQITLVNRDRRCTRCGAALPGDAVDMSVQQRRHAYKAAISRLAARAGKARMTDPSFARRGAALAVDAYVDTVLTPTLHDIPAVLHALKDEAQTATWGHDQNSVVAFQRIQRRIDQAINQVSTLAAMLPTIEMRAIHHLLTRAVGDMVAGHVALLASVVAADSSEAFECQREGQRLLDRAVATAQVLAELVPRINALITPGWWMSGTILNHAAIAWEAVQSQPSSIADAAERVRTGLPGVPGVMELDDAHALVMLPAIVVSAPVTDSVHVRQRAILAREVLDTADRDAPGWLADKDELVSRVGTAIRTVTEQAQRLGAAQTGAQYRNINARLLVDVYEGLVEGPLRDLGAIVVIAARAARGAANATYVPEVARGVQAGDLVGELAALGEPWRDAAQLHFRNAGAHGGVEVLDDGIKLTQERIKNGVVVDTKVEVVSDAEFAEEFASLQESSLALQLTVLPWLFGHSDPEVAQARDAAAPTRGELEGVIRLLAGLRGLLDVTITRGDTMITIAAYPAPSIDARDIAISSLVPAVFHNWPDIERVTLSVETREPVTFARDEVVGWDMDFGEARLAAVGLLSRTWVGDCPEPLRTRADLVYVCRAQLAALFAALQHVVDHEQSIDGVAYAEQIVSRVHSRLRAAHLPAPHSPLIDDVRNLLLDAVRSLRGLRNALVRRDQKAIRQAAQACAKVSTRMGHLSERVDAELANVSQASEERET
jgi:hypothetical protein